MNKNSNKYSQWLENEVRQWCDSLRKAGISNEMSVSELGDHFRSLVTKFSDAGSDDSQALEMAKEQLGHPAYLYQEFQKNGTSVHGELPTMARFSLLAFIPPLWLFLLSDMLENLIGRPTDGGTFWVPVETSIGFALMGLMSLMIIRRINWIRLVILTINYGFMFFFGVTFLLLVISGLGAELAPVWKLDPVLFETTRIYFTYTVSTGLLLAATAYVAYALTRPYVKSRFNNRVIDRHMPETD